MNRLYGKPVAEKPLAFPDKAMTTVGRDLILARIAEEVRLVVVEFARQKQYATVSANGQKKPTVFEIEHQHSGVLVEVGPVGADGGWRIAVWVNARETTLERLSSMIQDAFDSRLDEW